MLQAHWENIPRLELVEKLLAPWGQVARLGPNSLRYIPDDDRYPAFYFHANGWIDILAASADLFYRADCLEALQKWTGGRLTQGLDNRIGVID